eukprot:g8753.t1
MRLLCGIGTPPGPLPRSIRRGKPRPMMSYGGYLPVAPIEKDLLPQRRWSARSLAFLGDSVWELYVRRSQFYTVIHLDKMHKAVSETVNAQTQASHYEALFGSEFLNKTEREILRWGLNSKSANQNRSKATSVEAYRKSTALECLIGYLYLSDLPRLHSLMSHLGFVKDQDTY